MTNVQISTSYLHPIFICKIYRVIEKNAILHGNDLMIQTPVYMNVGCKQQYKAPKMTEFGINIYILCR